MSATVHDSAMQSDAYAVGPSSTNTATARIDVTALRENFATVQRLCPRSAIMAMVKADAYGHGLVPVARALDRADGFAVARLQEAFELRRAGVRQRVLLLATLLDIAAVECCSEHEIDVTVHDDDSLALILQASARHPLRVWLELDSGMHRTGLSSRAFGAAHAALVSQEGVRELVQMTHFSSADELRPTSMTEQLACFASCRKVTSGAKASLANSAALLRDHATHADWVRPGIMLYGDNPIDGSLVVLRPVMTLTSRVIAVREIEAGESVGYNARWRSAQRARIATVGIGYADGYPRHAQNGTPVMINGQLGRLAGRVSMDSVTVDVTDCDWVSPGDEAILWGPELPVARIASHAETVSHALLASLTPRVHREYTERPAHCV